MFLQASAQVAMCEQMMLFEDSSRAQVAATNTKVKLLLLESKFLSSQKVNEMLIAYESESFWFVIQCITLAGNKLYEVTFSCLWFTNQSLKQWGMYYG